jgi:hypothetical protein
MGNELYDTNVERLGAGRRNSPVLMVRSSPPNSGWLNRAAPRFYTCKQRLEQKNRGTLVCFDVVRRPRSAVDWIGQGLHAVD